MLIQISTLVFVFLTLIVIVFQLALAMGVPWGAASMGGKFPGKYPPKMRMVAAFNALVLFFFCVIVLSRANFIAPQLFSFSKTAIWFVIIFFGISTVMNIITPSKIERIWAPVAAFQLITSLIIALS
ncbi:MAG: hypothetical protein NZM09_02860 [Ignavibacterium sp.]|nr:hypothetical protein [Ignavibacterium sp.]MCX7611332.1 hypothetical protein [Ignavibacterium sp.]MDW8374617.1 hypothetical protein [Ignavibacteriales bacterium]